MSTSHHKERTPMYGKKNALRRAVAVCGMLLSVSAAKAEVQFSGELRLRPEFFDNADFNGKTKDTQSFVGSRLRVTGSGLAAENVAVKVTLQDTRLWGEGSPVG